MINLARIGAVAYTEFRFCLRRGGPIIGMAGAGLILTVVALYIGMMNVEGMSPSDATQAGAHSLADFWPAFEVLILGLLPIVVASAIPSDRQFGVFELLRSLPLTGGVYLIGKVLGTVAAALGTGLLVLAIHLVLHLVMIGTPQVDLYLKLAFFSALPIVLWAATIGVLAGAGLRTRLTAVLAGVPAGIAGFFIWNASIWFNLATGRSLAEQSPQSAHQAVSKFIIGQYDMLPPYVSLDPDAGSQALQSVIIAFLALLGVAIAARLWLLWKEDF